MSALIPLSKMLTALGQGFDTEAERADRQPTADLLRHMASAHHRAAAELNVAIFQEASGNEGREPPRDGR